jgi:aminotransferase
LTAAIRKVHDFLTVGAPAPLQEGVAMALEQLDGGYYTRLAADYRARRDLLCGALAEAGFRAAMPEGAYYVLADFSGLSALDDTAFSHHLTASVGVAPVPGSSFFHEPDMGKNLVRFAFCKTLPLLGQAADRLRAMGGGQF